MFLLYVYICTCLYIYTRKYQALHVESMMPHTAQDEAGASADDRVRSHPEDDVTPASANTYAPRSHTCSSPCTTTAGICVAGVSCASASARLHPSLLHPSSSCGSNHGTAVLLVATTGGPQLDPGSNRGTAVSLLPASAPVFHPSAPMRIRVLLPMPAWVGVMMPDSSLLLSRDYGCYYDYY